MSWASLKKGVAARQLVRRCERLDFNKGMRLRMQTRVSGGAKTEALMSLSTAFVPDSKAERTKSDGTKETSVRGKEVL